MLFRLVPGVLVDRQSGIEYKSESELVSDDILQLASIAKNVHRLNAYVLWCEVALEAARREKKSPSYISKIKKLIAQGKKDHDEVRIFGDLFTIW